MKYFVGDIGEITGGSGTIYLVEVVDVSDDIDKPLVEILGILKNGINTTFRLKINTIHRAGYDINITMPAKPRITKLGKFINDIYEKEKEHYEQSKSNRTNGKCSKKSTS